MQFSVLDAQAKASQDFLDSTSERFCPMRFGLVLACVSTRSSLWEMLIAFMADNGCRDECNTVGCHRILKSPKKASR